MLVLSRKKGEEILVLECGVTVKVVAVQGQTIRLGIAAPANITILRGEIWERDGRRPRGEPARG
jgi:carbon storage regulator